MTDVAPPTTGDALVDLLNGFIVELREAGLPVSLTENLDAMQAVRHIPLEDREAFKYALAATLVKNNAHWRAFETVFEVYFSFRGRHYAIGDEDEGPEDHDERGQGQGGRDHGGDSHPKWSIGPWPAPRCQAAPPRTPRSMKAFA